MADQGRISQVALMVSRGPVYRTGAKMAESVAKAVTGCLFGIAIVTAVLSTIVRLRLRNGIGLDDVFLLLACVFLIASTVLLFLVSNALYFEEALTLDPASVTFSADSFDQLDWYQKMIYAYLDLSQTATYCVKFSFLFFFRLLIDRLRYMIIYWRVVVVVSVLAWAYAMCTAFIGCPDFGLDISCIGESVFVKSVALSVTTSTLDIVTDLMIITIPVRLLWKVRIKHRQKFILGSTLCLSVFMIITCIIQMSGLGVSGTATGLGTSGQSFDVVWQVFWTQVEASVAVTVISFTSFRSLFVASNASPKNSKSLRWYSFKRSKDSHEKPLKGTPGESTTAQDSTGQRTLPAAHLSALKSIDDPAPPATGFAARRWPSDDKLTMPRVLDARTPTRMPSPPARRLEDKSLPPTPPSPLSVDSAARRPPPDEESLVGYPLANLEQPTQPYYQMSFEHDYALGETAHPPGQFVLDPRDSIVRPGSPGW
ncbi:hypothetical protein MMC26_002227 [Xylographa opegraphella]|nr:hypothetical protein [Xylographa opegraphella]